MFFSTKKDNYRSPNGNIRKRQYMFIILAIIILAIIIFLCIYLYNNSNTKPEIPTIKHRYIPLKE
jgi:uncharacterized membrane protein YhaH (DUF805 family)